MKEVKSYQSLDGQLFTDKEKCFEQDLLISIRGIIQRSGDSSNTITVTEAASRIKNKASEVKDLLDKYFVAKRRRARYTAPIGTVFSNPYL